MNWAIKDKQRITAKPKQIANCPICNEKVISKCGSIKVWHWAHKSNIDCDEWYEPETQWHREWKSKFPKEQQEIIIGKHRADIKTKEGLVIELQNSSISSKDIIERENYYKEMIWLLNGGTLAKGLMLREKKEIITFRWKNPPKCWWFSHKEIYIDLSKIIYKLKEKLKDYTKGIMIHTSPIREQIEYEYYTAEGEYCEVSYPKIVGNYNTTNLEIKNLKRKIELFESNLFLIKKIYHKCPCGGWGTLISKTDFLNKFKKEDDTQTTKEP